MFSRKAPHLKKNRNIILFQIHSNKPTPICISISQTASLADLYQKVEETLFPISYSSFEERNSENSGYKMFVKNTTNVHRIFACTINREKFLTIPNSSRQNVSDYVETMQDYFPDHSQIPQLHNLYKIYAMDQSDYAKYKDQDSVTEMFVNNVRRLTKCFG
jgi:hypothetical protein